jgi:hypothetical protein
MSNFRLFGGGVRERGGGVGKTGLCPGIGGRLGICDCLRLARALGEGEGLSDCIGGVGVLNGE